VERLQKSNNELKKDGQRYF
jgi:chromosome segregation ATPase